MVCGWVLSVCGGRGSGRPEVLIVGGCDVLARVRVFWANLIGLVLLFGLLGL